MNNRMRRVTDSARFNAMLIVVAGLLGLLTADVRGATKIDFSFEDDLTTPLVNGQKIDELEEFGILFTVLGAGPNSGVAIFDSTPGINLPDPDLWVGLGNIMILQENAGGAGALTGDIFDTPNDDPTSNNFIHFNFIGLVSVHAIDLIDIDDNGPVTVTLTDANNNIRRYAVPKEWTYDISAPGLPVGAKGYDTLDLTTLADQTGEGGATATATEDPGFDPNAVTRLSVEFDGSGGLDNLIFAPEPGTLLMLVAAAPFVLRRRRA